MTDPDGAMWEWYVKTGDAEQMANQVVGAGEGVACCAPTATTGAESVSQGADSAGGCC